LNVAVTSHHAKALANLMRHVVTTVVVLAVRVAVALVVVTKAVVTRAVVLTLVAITALPQRLRVVLMTVLHADHALCLKAIVHRLTKKLHVLNQVAVSHLVVVGSMLKSVPLSQNLTVNLDA
jgi:hypothetical protein